MVMIVSQAYTYPKTDQITYIKYVQPFTCQSQFNSEFKNQHFFNQKEFVEWTIKGIKKISILKMDYFTMTKV